MKFEMEIKRVTDDPLVYKGTLKSKSLKIDVSAKWKATPDMIAGIKKRMMNADMIGAFEVSKRLIRAGFKSRFYPDGDPLKTPAQRADSIRAKIKDKVEELEEP